MKPWSDPIYFYGLPTYKQAKRVAWWKIKKLVPEHWIKKANDGDMVIETVFGSKLFIVGLDKPQRVEGDQWDGCVIDESSDVKPGTFALSVLPALSHRNGWCWRIGVAKRYGVGAAEFRAAFEAGFSEEDPERASYWWPSSSVLTEEQLRWAKENLDPKDYEEQYDASWVTAGGAVFYCFDRAHNISPKAVYRRDLPIVLGVDFNVDPMAWTVSHQVGDQFHTFDEFFIRNTNTEATLTRVAAKYGGHDSGWWVMGDATGSARKTSASRSDYQTIMADPRLRGKRLLVPKGNPPFRDRAARANRMLLAADGTRRWLIHPQCVHLWNDLEARTWKPGVAEPQDGGDLGHMSDAGTYPIYGLYPIRSGEAAGAVHAHGR